MICEPSLINFNRRNQGREVMGRSNSPPGKTRDITSRQICRNVRSTGLCTATKPLNLLRTRTYSPPGTWSTNDEACSHGKKNDGYPRQNSRNPAREARPHIFYFSNRSFSRRTHQIHERRVGKTSERRLIVRLQKGQYSSKVKLPPPRLPRNPRNWKKLQKLLSRSLFPLRRSRS